MIVDVIVVVGVALIERLGLRNVKKKKS